MTSYNQKLRLNKTFTEIPPFRHLQIGSRGRVFALWMDSQPAIMTITIALQLHHMARGRREKTIWVILRYWILSLKMTFAQNLPELLWMTKYNIISIATDHVDSPRPKTHKKWRRENFIGKFNSDIKFLWKALRVPLVLVTQHWPSHILYINTYMHVFLAE